MLWKKQLLILKVNIVTVASETCLVYLVHMCCAALTPWGTMLMTMSIYCWKWKHSRTLISTNTIWCPMKASGLHFSTTIYFHQLLLNLPANHRLREEEKLVRESLSREAAVLSALIVMNGVTIRGHVKLLKVLNQSRNRSYHQQRLHTYSHWYFYELYINF